MDFDDSYWSEKYLQHETGWDIGYASPAILHYFVDIKDKSNQILIPGGGNGYEAAALYEAGFKNVHLLDFATPPLKQFQNKYPDFPAAQLHRENFFDHQGAYDIIVEQTFFCALMPNKRGQYVQKMHSLIKRGGRLVGLLFDKPLNEDKPPFGGNKVEYLKRFEKYFKVHQMSITPHSIPPRLGSELFIELEPLEI